MLCELYASCPYFNGSDAVSPRLAAIFRAQYCRGGQADCARYLVFMARGRDGVPVDLAPNDRLRALRIVQGHEPAAVNGQRDGT